MQGVGQSLLADEELTDFSVEVKGWDDVGPKRRLVMRYRCRDGEGVSVVTITGSNYQGGHKQYGH